jgi:hypothetical protein
VFKLGSSKKSKSVKEDITKNEEIETEDNDYYSQRELDRSEKTVVFNEIDSIDPNVWPDAFLEWVKKNDEKEDED